MSEIHQGVPQGWSCTALWGVLTYLHTRHEQLGDGVDAVVGEDGGVHAYPRRGGLHAVGGQGGGHDGVDPGPG